MSQKTYTRTEVVDMLTSLTKEHIEMFANCGSSFPWERDGESGTTLLPSMYGEIYGKVMSLIEMSVDKDKIEPTKTIARQLLQSAQESFHTQAHNSFCDAINNKSNDVISGVYTLIAKKLND